MTKRSAPGHPLGIAQSALQLSLVSSGPPNPSLQASACWQPSASLQLSIVQARWSSQSTGTSVQQWSAVQVVLKHRLKLGTQSDGTVHSPQSAAASDGASRTASATRRICSAQAE